MSSATLGMPGAFWPVWLWWHQQGCQHWTPIALESAEGEGGYGGISLWSLLCWLWSRPLCSLWGNGGWSKLTSPGCSFWGESPVWWNLNGCGVDRCERGCLGPLASIRCSVMAWAMVHRPSCIVQGSVARYAGLPTQAPMPVSVNVASLTSPRLRPSPNDHLP